ncbi:NADPH-dependent ferric siderophore reductase [Duganella sp. 1411]|uniref:siderophore-interacting protein n=1 Tax=Duganella sp. 1411 TaxID=2806572 RepID=UPI001AE56F3C|nr:siderophore-interacting protein [Duganella sp. 1411]MBP1203514.1 NADPH-dependent ferric siderophore reductase [Duganella sp. 1411]
MNDKRIQRVRHELKPREVTVSEVRQLAPNFVSVTFKGESLHDFVSLSYDDHVKFILHDAAGERVMRDYTPRRYDRDARELTLEFALHTEGHMTDWARQARVGQQAVIGGPKGSMIIPTDYAWHILAGDATALPAIRRRLEELPAAADVLVLVTGEEAAALEFASAARLRVQLAPTPEDVVEAFRAMRLPEGDGFIWCAGEARMASQVRDILFVDKAFPREAARISAYWKQGASAHHENLE